MTLRKTFEGDLKKMELTWGTAESEARDRSLWRGRNGSLSPTDRGNQKRRMSNIYKITKVPVEQRDFIFNQITKKNYK